MEDLLLLPDTPALAALVADSVPEGPLAAVLEALVQAVAQQSSAVGKLHHALKVHTALPRSDTTEAESMSQSPEKHPEKCQDTRIDNKPNVDWQGRPNPRSIAGRVTLCEIRLNALLKALEVDVHGNDRDAVATVGALQHVSMAQRLTERRVDSLTTSVQTLEQAGAGVGGRLLMSPTLGGGPVVRSRSASMFEQSHESPTHMAGRGAVEKLSMHEMRSKWTEELEERLKAHTAQWDDQLAAKADAALCERHYGDAIAQLGRLTSHLNQTLEERIAAVKETVPSSVLAAIDRAAEPVRRDLAAALEAAAQAETRLEQYHRLDAEVGQAISRLQADLGDLQAKAALMEVKAALMEAQISNPRDAPPAASAVTPRVSVSEPDGQRLTPTALERPVGRRGRPSPASTVRECTGESRGSLPPLEDDARTLVQAVQPTAAGRRRWLALLRQLRQGRPLSAAQALQLRQLRQHRPPLSPPDAHIRDLLAQIEEGRPLTAHQQQDLTTLVELAVAGPDDAGTSPPSSRLETLARSVERLQQQVMSLLSTDVHVSSSSPGRESHAADDGPADPATAVRYRCLSCNRPSGPFAGRPGAPVGRQRSFPPGPILVTTAVPTSPTALPPPAPGPADPTPGPGPLEPGSTAAQQKLLSYFERLAVRATEGTDVASRLTQLVPRPPQRGRPPKASATPAPLTLVGRDGRMYHNADPNSVTDSA